MKKCFKVLDMLYLPKHISNHLFGVGHSNKHRMFVGLAVVLVGTLIHHLSSIHYEPIKFVADVSVDFLHGVGVVPFVEALKPTE